MVIDIVTADTTVAVVVALLLIYMTRTFSWLLDNSLTGTLPREWSALGSLNYL